jgi:hypothetical protein
MPRHVLDLVSCLVDGLDVDGGHGGASCIIWMQIDAALYTSNALAARWGAHAVVTAQQAQAAAQWHEHELT